MKTAHAIAMVVCSVLLLGFAVNASFAGNPPAWTGWTPVGTGQGSNPAAGGGGAGGSAISGAVVSGIQTLASAYMGAVMAYVLAYASLLGIAIAWGQAGTNTLPNFFMGSVIVIGSGTISQIYIAVFP